ncbi:3-keto-5-aminohexanoate cleavage protein [Ammoniphilus sp. CFH 90114]|uniref:3-keto-5-aminohexanoate cleavage protein n=1 Tax=Ammoniphilus sp. CFH 90114 TaxID=2493665 RepID=UPI00100E7113|nr:3-keto-5-aminohexanoate cleavage protein [Ammoniphilus sp. CFH 90114]RXT07182.1 3-keto-5-aminohexanoate cleavage protein [Ammoniphilus sp. CFH 90114]
MKKLIVNFAPTGMIPTKAMTPHVPISPKEIIQDVLKCAPLGVSIAHLHARDSHGIPTYHKEVYGEIIRGVREHNQDLILCVSTSGRNFPEFSKRAEVLDLDGPLKPDMASLTLSSLNFIQSESMNAPLMIMKLAEKMAEKGIKPELEVFDLGMINFAKYLIKKGLLEPPYYFNILLGNVASAQANINHLGLMISELPSPCYYSITGLGESQKEMTALGVILADGVRIGLEDNIWLNKKNQRLATNEDLVQRIIHIAQAYERPIMTPQETRGLLGM